MTATAGSPEPSAPPRSPSTPLARPPAARPLGPDLVRAEWTKLRTVRSTWWTIALTMAGMVVLGALFCARYGIGGISPSDRATFAATPQRQAVLAAKAVVVGVVTALIGTASAFAAFLVGQAVLAQQGLQAHLGDPGVLRSVVGAGLYLAVLGLLAVGLGTLIRSTVGATAVVVGLVFVLP